MNASCRLNKGITNNEKAQTQTICPLTPQQGIGNAIIYAKPKISTHFRLLTARLKMCVKVLSKLFIPPTHTQDQALGGILSRTELCSIITCF